MLGCCLNLNDSASTDFFFSFLVHGMASGDLESAALLFLLFTGGHYLSESE